MTAPAPLASCTCSHLVTAHRINGKGQRATCSARLGAARCACRLFVKAGA